MTGDAHPGDKKYDSYTKTREPSHTSPRPQPELARRVHHLNVIGGLHQIVEARPAHQTRGDLKQKVLSSVRDQRRDLATRTHIGYHGSTTRAHRYRESAINLNVVPHSVKRLRHRLYRSVGLQYPFVDARIQSACVAMCQDDTTSRRRKMANQRSARPRDGHQLVLDVSVKREQSGPSRGPDSQSITSTLPSPCFRSMAFTVVGNS